MLLPGIYTVLVTDANGCSLGLDTAEILAGENPDLLTTITNVSCFGADDGVITPSATGGATPYQFSNNGSQFFSSGNVFSNLVGNFYFVTVLDSLGCGDTDSIFVEEPALLEITNINIDNVSCNGANDGQLTPVISGGRTPYTYIWDDINNQNKARYILINFTADNKAIDTLNEMIKFNDHIIRHLVLNTKII